MREHRASYTAGLVALGRALANEQQRVRGFSDPFAERLLPPKQQAAFARLHQKSRGLRDAAFRGYVEQLAMGMALRTVAIDEGLRSGLRGKQVVILGAGLDSRAWRLGELQGATVFEVDHPATQAYKRERTQGLTPLADVRFVAVNFERDSLAQRLEEAGHDPKQPTVWIWEGVVMYLRLPDIEATLRVVSSLSAAGSRLIVHYASPSLERFVLGQLLRLVGEPFRSTFKPPVMAAMLQRHGFRVLSDESAGELGPRLVKDPQALRPTMRHQRVAIADRS